MNLNDTQALMLQQELKRNTEHALSDVPSWKEVSQCPSMRFEAHSLMIVTVNAEDKMITDEDMKVLSGEAEADNAEMQHEGGSSGD